MRTCMKWAAALIFLVPVKAEAQDPDVPEGATVKLLLLRQKSVQKELELSPEATKKVADFTTKQSDAARKAVELPAAQHKEAFEKLTKENEKFLADTLNEKQTKRLDQIAMQTTGLTYLLKPEMIKELKLSDDQVKKFKDLQTESRKTLLELYKSKEAGKNEKLTKLREDTRTKILAVLTEDQKAKVREIAGPPFEGELVFEEPE